MNWLTIVRMFSGPIGQLVSTGLAAGAGALTTWAATKGFDEAGTQVIVGGLFTAVAAAINMATGTQLVKIQDIRQDQHNGVTVVDAFEARSKGIKSVDAPMPHHHGA